MKLKVVSAALIVLGLALSGWLLLRRQRIPIARQAEEFTGSAGCRNCHEAFYEKWAPSWHGLAMRPYTAAFARENLARQPAPIEIRGRTYRAELEKKPALVSERGPEGERAYEIRYVLGGKNVFFFLTPRPGGKLQVLPLAFDSHRKEWYDTTGSMVRHLPGLSDAPLDWSERQLTFNTSCYSCHVSQLSKNYSLQTDTYQTVWGEPGINCEACHGPGGRHVQAMRADSKNTANRLNIIVTRAFSTAQTNSLCGPCHAKMSPLDASFRPGDRFFDHYNLAALEDRDFFPDGRDMGENFTYTLWLISPCAASGQLDCVHCHTSSGRNKHPGAKADEACLPCHAGHVRNPAAHAHHRPESAGSRCVSCHMPETSFARMKRHDHTMLPPVPAATLRFGSPNACNICHKDRDARWSDRWVRKWYGRDYQAPLVRRAGLIDAARKGDWAQLGEMTAYLAGPKPNEVFAASLLRLIERCPNPQKWPAYVKSLGDPSPLVRSSAAAGLADYPGPEAAALLAKAAGDPYKVVRVQAGAALSRVGLDSLGPDLRRRAEGALAEYEESMRCRPDDPRSHYNLGAYFQEQGDPAAARVEYETALRLLPSFVPALVNVSVVSARLGEPDKAERALREALRYEPDSAEANFNLGLLLAEQQQPQEAETCLRKALTSNPNLAEAAYNLAVLIAGNRIEESITLCRKASMLRPDDARYAYTLAFYLHQKGDAGAAVAILEPLIARDPHEVDALALLGSIFEETGRRERAAQLYRKAAADGGLPAHMRQQFASLLEALEHHRD